MPRHRKLGYLGVFIMAPWMLVIQLVLAEWSLAFLTLVALGSAVALVKWERM